MKIKKGELIIPALMAATTAAYYFQVWAKGLPYSVVVWPIYVTITLLILLALVVVFYIPAEGVSEEKKEAKLFKETFKKPLFLFLTTVLFLAIMPWVGYTVSSFAYLFGVQLYLGSEKKRAFLVALAIAIILHVVMVVLLGLSVPRLETSFFTL